MTLRRCPDRKGFGRATLNPVTTSLTPTGFKTATEVLQQCYSQNELSGRLHRDDKETNLRRERVLMRNTGSGHIREAIREQVKVYGCHLLGKKQSAEWCGQRVTIKPKAPRADFHNRHAVVNAVAGLSCLPSLLTGVCWGCCGSAGPPSSGKLLEEAAGGCQTGPHVCCGGFSSCQSFHSSGNPGATVSHLRGPLGVQELFPISTCNPTRVWNSQWD